MNERVDFQASTTFSTRVDLGRHNSAVTFITGIVTAIISARTDLFSDFHVETLTHTLAAYSETLSQGRLAQLIDAIQNWNLVTINKFLVEAQAWANAHRGHQIEAPFDNNMIAEDEFEIDDVDEDLASFSDSVATMDSQETGGWAGFTVNMTGGPQPIGALAGYPFFFDAPVSNVGANSQPFGPAAKDWADQFNAGIFGGPKGDPNNEASGGELTLTQD